MDSCIARSMKCMEDTGKPLLNSTFVSSRKCYFLVRYRPYRNHENVKLSQLINAVKGIILGKSLNGLGVLRLSIWSFLFTSLLWLLREKEWCVCSIKVQFSIHWSNFLNHYNLKNSRLQIITRLLFNSQQLPTLNMILAQCQQLLERTGEMGKKARNCYAQHIKKKKKHASVSPICYWCCSFSMQLSFKMRLQHMRFLVIFFFISLACNFIKNEIPPWKFWEVFPPVIFIKKLAFIKFYRL